MATDNTAAAAKNAMQKNSNKLPALKPNDSLKGLKTTQVQSLLNAYLPQIQAALPKHLTPDRMIQVVTTLISRTPAIAECTVQSLVGAVLTCSTLGLEPVPQLGLAYFVPFMNKGKREVQFILGYRGMLALARRSGEISTTFAEIVYANDNFSYQLGLNPDITHVPAEGKRGEMTHVYAVVKYVNGGHNFVVMTVEDVEKIKRRSKAGNSKHSPWTNKDDYPAMAKKTAIRQLFKYAPTSTEVITHANLLDGKVVEQAAFPQGQLDVMSVPDAEYEEVEDQTEGGEKDAPDGEESQSTDIDFSGESGPIKA